MEDQQVLLLFQSIGTPTNTAIHKYVNSKGVPHLFIGSAASKWGDPKNFPWTMAWRPAYQVEARIYADYILKNYPHARIAVLHSNDDFGKDFMKGLQSGLADMASTSIVAEATYESTDAGLDSQIVALQASGADTFINVTAGKFVPLAIRKAFDSGWKPRQFLVGVSTGVAANLSPAGLDKSAGIISAHFLKDPTDIQWTDDPAYKEWLDWMRRYYPEGNVTEMYNVEGYTAAQLLVHLLQQCGDDLGRENVMRQAANLKDVELPMLLPGIKINTSPNDFFPIEQLQLMRFDGKRWVRFGDVLGN